VGYYPESYIKMTYRIKIYLLLAGIILSALCLRSYKINSRWQGGHIGFNGAYYSMVARNHLRYGFLKTRFMSMRNTYFNPSEMKYNLHHPPLVGILTALSFSWFGESERAARFIPIVFSLASIVIIFLLVRELWGDKIALWASFFTAIMPMDVFYGPQVEVFGSLVLFFILVSYLTYRKWRQKSSVGYLVLSLLCFLIAICTEWTGYYILILIGIEEISGRRHNRNFSPLLLSYIIIGIGGFILYLNTIRVIAGSIFGGGWIDSLLFRLNITAKSSLSSFTFSAYILKLGIYLFSYFGSPILLLSAIGFLQLFSSIKEKQKKAKNMLTANLLVLGWLHPLFFKNAVYIHSYTLFNLTPSFALLSAIGIVGIQNYLIRNKIRWQQLFLSSILILCVVNTGTNLAYQYKKMNKIERYQLGHLIKEKTKPNEITITSFVATRECEYYADRNVIYGIKTIEEFLTIIDHYSANPPACYITNSSSQWQSKLTLYLSKKHPFLREGPYLLFDLRKNRFPKQVS